MCGRAHIIWRGVSQLVTKTGLRTEAEHDLTGVKVGDAQFSAVRLRRHEFHGGWNYTITAA